MRFHPSSTLATLILLLAVPAAGEELRAELKRAPVQSYRPTEDWAGRQFLQADAKGRLFLLRAETFEVYAVSAEGQLGEPTLLKRSQAGLLPTDGPILAAAMSSDGADWVVLESFRPRVFRQGKEEPVADPKLAISGLAMVRNQPVVAGFPLTAFVTASDGEELPADLPWLQAWDGKKWTTLASQSWSERRAERLADLQETHAAWLAGTPEGRLWVAACFERRFEERSSGGRRLTEISVDEGKIRRLPNAAALERAAAADAKRMAASGTRISMAQITAEVAAIALAEGRDGRTYFLTRATEKKGPVEVVLERYDPVTQRLERQPLPFSLPGDAGTLAAGRDGLWIAALQASEGLWRLLWEDLDVASWQPVEGARVQGIPVNPEEAGDAMIKAEANAPKKEQAEPKRPRR